MNWNEWIKNVIEYKDNVKDDAEKYIAFERWGSELLELRELTISSSFEKVVKSLIAENFEQDKQVGDSYGLVQSILREFIEYLKKKDSQAYSKVISDVTKVTEFIDQQVYSFLEDISDETANDTVPQSYENAVEKLKRDVVSLKREVREHEQEVKNNTTSIIITNVEILGIFVAIAFALFGIFNVISSTASIIEADIYRIIFVASLLSFILFNLVFLLLYAISRFTEKSIAMNCSKTNNSDIPCRNCQKRKYLKWWCKLKHKFTYLMIINVFCILGMVTMLFLRFWIQW